jgi:putative two-component system response regulator
MPFEKARQIIIDGRGTHFDPVLTDLFVPLSGEFEKIARRASAESSLRAPLAPS